MLRSSTSPLFFISVFICIRLELHTERDVTWPQKVRSHLVLLCCFVVDFLLFIIYHLLWNSTIYSSNRFQNDFVHLCILFLLFTHSRFAHFLSKNDTPFIGLYMGDQKKKYFVRKVYEFSCMVRSEPFLH